MERSNLMVRVTLWVNRAIVLLLAALIPALPFLLDWYATIRILTQWEYYGILIGFYCCLPAIGGALWKLERLLKNLLAQQVFTEGNVTCLRWIRSCCGLVSLICLPVSVIYLPLLFVMLIMAFLCLTVSVMVRVMAAAVAIREENDLTV